MGFCVPSSDSPPFSVTLAWCPDPVPSHWVAWGKSLPISDPQCCPVTWGDSMLSPGGLQGARRGEHFLGTRLARSETGAGTTASTRSPFLQHVLAPRPLQAYLPHSAPTGEQAISSPSPEPMVSTLAPPLSDIPGCFLCVFVRGHPVPSLNSGDLWEGPEGRSDPGVIWPPSFNSFLPRTSCPTQLSFLEGLILLAGRLPPPSPLISIPQDSLPGLY